jgi:hypothetical protein
MYAVLAEKGWYSKEREDLFYKEVQGLADKLPDSISGIVLGKVWLDGTGGHIRHSVHSVSINPTASHKVDPERLKELLQPDPSPSVYPQFGIPSFFEFSEGPIDESTEQVKSGES